MWQQQVGYVFITLFLATGILCFIGILIFNVSKKFSGLLFKEEKLKYLNIAFAGTILIALSQLFGPLFAATYPLICGPDASDYSLSSDWIYIDVSYNNSTGNYSYERTIDSAGLLYDSKKETPISILDSISINNIINATNLNPFMNYDNQIFLSVEANDDVLLTSLSRPVIKVGQSSILNIEFMNKPYPGTYHIKVVGESGDGKKRKAMMVIGISIPVIRSGSVGVYSGDSTGTSYTFTPTRPTNSGSYTPKYSTNSGSYTPKYSTNSGSYTPNYSTDTMSYTL
jgi:hypothetical protein